MAELNQYNCIGRLTRDPELKYTSGGTAVASFGLAVNRTYTKDNEKKQDTCFIDVTAWGRMGEVISEYMAKGGQVFITGRLQLDQWTDKRSDEKRSKIKLVAENIQFLGDKHGSGNGGGNSGGGSSAPRGRPNPTPPSGPDDWNTEEEDVPF